MGNNSFYKVGYTFVILPILTENFWKAPFFLVDHFFTPWLNHVSFSLELIIIFGIPTV